ncbi:MAG: DNA-protecting protein DprA [Bacteroidetes bacterium]|nr:DNA-protecting protein DprA [Bacteroidota bacterium]
MDKELAYWLALAHLPTVRTKKKNEIIVKLFEEQKTISDFFHSDKNDWLNNYDIAKDEIFLFEKAINELSNYSFMVEDILEQGYSIIPITSSDYSPILKKNLGRTFAPPLIYTKGNKNIMKEPSIAIVGSRKADKISLEFTDNIAKKASKEHKVVVSGFAKGVDKQALDSALKYKGKGIIVLPQGIATFESGFKKYYKQVIEGNVLILSTFFPKAPWSVEFAMSRNPIIYGLANDIYVAQSSSKGGTWSGVVDGLRKGRNIYVRSPNLNEKNANNLLIQQGAIPVSLDGEKLTHEQIESLNSIVSKSDLNSDEKKIIEFLKKGVYTSKKIIDTLKINWTSIRVTSFLKEQKDIITVEGKPMKFTHKDRTIQAQKTLFE